MWLKVHVDGLFTCHVIGWRRIPSNQVRGKLLSIEKGKTPLGWYKDFCEGCNIIGCFGGDGGKNLI